MATTCRSWQLALGDVRGKVEWCGRCVRRICILLGCGMQLWSMVTKVMVTRF